MQNHILEFILSTCHFTALSTLQANQHTKLDQAMLITRQIFATKCDVASEWYCICNVGGESEPLLPQSHTFLINLLHACVLTYSKNT